MVQLWSLFSLVALFTERLDLCLIEQTMHRLPMVSRSTWLTSFGFDSGTQSGSAEARVQPIGFFGRKGHIGRLGIVNLQVVVAQVINSCECEL